MRMGGGEGEKTFRLMIEARGGDWREKTGVRVTPRLVFEARGGAVDEKDPSDSQAGEDVEGRGIEDEHFLELERQERLSEVSH